MSDLFAPIVVDFPLEKAGYSESLLTPPELKVIGPSAIPAKSFINNPRLYQKQIDRLERLVFNLGKGIFNIQIQPSTERNEGAKAVVCLSHPSPDNDNIVDELLFEVEQNLTVLQGILRSLETFQKTKFSGPTFNVIAVDPKRDWVLRVVAITVADLNLLHKILSAGKQILFNEQGRSEVNWRIIDNVIEEMNEAALNTLSHIGLLPSTEENSEAGEDMPLRNLSYVFSMTFVLFFGLVAFIRSHIGSFDTLFGTHLDEIIFESAKNAFTLSRHHLACLEEFTDGPVWAFSDTQTHYQTSFSTQLTSVSMTKSRQTLKTYYLSTSLAQFASLWGLLRVWNHAEYPNVLARIHTRGGYIQRTLELPPGRTSGDMRPDETLCHWHSRLDTKTRELIRYDYLSEPIRPLLLIGVPYPKPEVHIKGKLEVTLGCTNISQNYWKSYEQYFLGTDRSHHFLDAMSVQFSISRIVGVAIGEVWKVHPATTLKDVILDDWLHNSSIKLDTDYDPQPGYLDYCTVLEVSRCTGNTRRISLRDVLTIPEVVRWLHTVHDRDTFADTETYLTDLACFSNFERAWSACPHKSSMRRIIRTILRALEKTGVDSKASLQVWDITYADKNGGLMGRRLNQRWIPMVKDSESVASFAVMTNGCIEVRNRENIAKRTDTALLFTNVLITLHAYNVTDGKRRRGLEEADMSFIESFEDSLDRFENDLQDHQRSDLGQNPRNIEEHDDLYDHMVPYQAVSQSDDPVLASRLRDVLNRIDNGLPRERLRYEATTNIGEERPRIAQRPNLGSGHSTYRGYSQYTQRRDDEPCAIDHVRHFSRLQPRNRPRFSLYGQHLPFRGRNGRDIGYLKLWAGKNGSAIDLDWLSTQRAFYATWTTLAYIDLMLGPLGVKLEALDAWCERRHQEWTGDGPQRWRVHCQEYMGQPFDEDQRLLTVCIE